MKALLFKLVLKIGTILSLKNSRSFSRILGKMIWVFSKKNKHVTSTNIAKCFPGLSQNEQEKLSQKAINSTIMNMLELGKIWNKDTKASDLIHTVSGEEEFAQALKLGQGLLLALPHMGNWEVMNLVLSQHDKYAFLYKPPSDKNIEKMLVDNRGHSNAVQIEANTRGVRQIIKHLKNNGFVTILPDQRPKGGQGIFAPFYGIPTYTMSLFSRLAIKTKVPVFFAYALRTENGFDVYFEKSDDDIYKDIEASVAYLNHNIQRIVDKAPEQYQWTYKRFSIQPDDEPSFY